MVRTGLTQDIRFPLQALEIGANFRGVLVSGRSRLSPVP